MLQKIYWVEAHAEELVLWEALIESGEEAKQTLDTIIQDSEKHKILAQMWLNKFGIEPPASSPIGFPEKAFDLRGKDVAEMFKDILKYEILMKGMYERLLNAEYEGCIKSLIPDENGQEEFFSWVRGADKCRGQACGDVQAEYRGVQADNGEVTRSIPFTLRSVRFIKMTFPASP